MRVIKVGGSILDGGAGLGRVADHLARQPPGAAVVTSALKGVTDAILGALPRVRSSVNAVPDVIHELRDHHHRAAHDARAADAVDAIEEQLARLERLLYGVAYTEEVTPRSQDLALTFGERFGARLLAAALNGRGRIARALDAEEAGVHNDGVHGAASPDLGTTTKAMRDSVRPLVEQGIVPVITGYYGIDRNGHIATFGRGGSDYSAAIVARCLDAEVLEVWKDVRGFLTADPKLVPAARPVDVLTYGEAAELASVGAKVLHPRAVEPLEPARIPIRVRSIAHLDEPGTIIQADAPVRPLRAIGIRRGLGVLRVEGPGLGTTPGVGKEIFTALGNAGVNVMNMAASQASFAMLVAEGELARGKEALEQAWIPVVEHVHATSGHALVCFVGQGLGHVPGVAGRVFTTVAEAGVNVEMISVGASDIALNFVVLDGDVERAARALHARFLEGEP